MAPHVRQGAMNDGWNIICQIMRNRGIERELLSGVVFEGSESGGVLQDSVGEDSSFENKNDLVMGVESSPAPAG